MFVANRYISQGNAQIAIIKLTVCTYIPLKKRMRSLSVCKVVLLIYLVYKQAAWTTKFHEQEITGWQKTIYYLDLFFRNGGLLVRRWRKAKTTLWTAQFLAKISRKRECVKTGRKRHCIWPDTCVYTSAFSWDLCQKLSNSLGRFCFSPSPGKRWASYYTFLSLPLDKLKSQNWGQFGIFYCLILVYTTQLLKND